MPGVTHSNIPFASNVFVNGGPTLGGAVAEALGLPDSIGISDADARQILSDRAATIAEGGNPDKNEALEQYGSGSPGGINPITGQEGAIPAPGSDSAISTDADAADSSIGDRPTSQWITVDKHVDPRVLPEVWTKAENFAKSLNRTLRLTSAYRAPEYNAQIGGAKESVHTERKALDIDWGTGSIQGRVDMIQKAIDAGFTGIGCYDNFMHIDTGAKRHWGPSGGRVSQFEQYKPVLKSNGYVT